MSTYYAAINAYGSEINHGFVNTWDVLAFNSKESRDAFIEGSSNITAEAIAKRNVTKRLAYSDRPPRPFSGERWVIADGDNMDEDPPSRPEGCIGHVIVDRGHERVVRDFY